MARRRKILYVITKSNFGGAQRYVYDLATHLPRGSYDVAVALGGTGRAQSESGPLQKKLEASGIRTIVVRHFARDITVVDDVRASIELFHIFRREKPDIIHLNSSKAAGIGAFVGRLLGVPSILVTIHGWPYHEPTSLWSRMVRMYFSWLTAMLATHVITISHDDFDSGAHLPLLSHKLSLIHNGEESFELLSQKTARAKLSLLLNIPAGAPTQWIGTISELNKNLGISYALEAFARAAHTSDALFIIIGEGEEKASLGGLAKQLNIQSNVFFTGYLENARHYLKAFDIFLYTPLKVGLPYALMEAGWASLPVIASDVGGIPDIIESRASGLLVHPRNADETSKALTYLMEHPARSVELGEQLHQRVSKQFSLAKMVRETTARYRASVR